MLLKFTHLRNNSNNFQKCFIPTIHPFKPYNVRNVLKNCPIQCFMSCYLQLGKKICFDILIKHSAHPTTSKWLSSKQISIKHFKSSNSTTFTTPLIFLCY